MEMRRKHPAHPPVRERFNEPIIVFLTVCSKDRKQIFAQTDSVAVILDAWHKAKSWSVGRYVVMPDHLHIFCAPGIYPTEPLMQWLRYWKSVASKKWPPSRGTADLATRFLGHAIAAFRKLRLQVAVCRR
jgi:putative transposase